MSPNRKDKEATSLMAAPTTLQSTSTPIYMV